MKEPNEYEVILVYSQTIDVNTIDAHGHRIETSEATGVPPFIVFYRDLPLLIDPLTPAHDPGGNDHTCICGWEVDGFTAPELVPEKLAGHIRAEMERLTLQPALQMDGEPLTFDDPTPTATAVSATTQLEVFRAPLHALLYVKLLGEDDERADA